MAKTQPAKKPMSKNELLGAIATATGLTKKDVAAVLEALQEEIRKSLTRGPGVFVIPGLLKIEKRKIPPRPARKGVMVFGQLRDLPAKPGTTKVQVRVLKALKEMVKK